MLGLSLLLVDLGLDMEGMPSEMLPGTPLSMLLALVQSLLLLDLTRTLLALTPTLTRIATVLKALETRP